MKKIILFLFLLPSFAIAQDTVIITKMYAEDTVWKVKKVYEDDIAISKTFDDSTQIYYYILNDIVDEARKFADAFNLFEKHNQFLNTLQGIDKAMINGNILGAFDYLSNQYGYYWIAKYNAIVNGTKALAGAEIFVNKNNELRIKIGESINKPFIAISDTYGIISNYPTTGQRMILYRTSGRNFKDTENKLIIRKIK